MAKQKKAGGAASAQNFVKKAFQVLNERKAEIRAKFGELRREDAAIDEEIRRQLRGLDVGPLVDGAEGGSEGGAEGGRSRGKGKPTMAQFILGLLRDSPDGYLSSDIKQLVTTDADHLRPSTVHPTLTALKERGLVIKRPQPYGGRGYVWRLRESPGSGDADQPGQAVTQ